MPFEAGDYQVAISTDGTTLQCAGDLSSKMTVTTTSLIINSCRNDDTYRKCRLLSQSKYNIINEQTWFKTKY